MANIQRFSTRSEAQNMVAEMIGWPGARAEELDGGDDANYWVVAVPRAGEGADQYLMDDGVVG